MSFTQTIVAGLDGESVDKNTWLKPPAAAHRLGVSVNYLAKLRIYGGGPKFAKFGAAVRYKVADLDIWSNGRTYGSTSSYTTREAA